TVQTRARYFFFVPWIYRHLEAKRLEGDKLVRQARELEVALIDRLLESGDDAGVIGKLSRNRLKRLPSSIYWNGLGTLGFFTRRDLSHHDYHLQVGRRAEARLQRDDDGELLVDRSQPLWHPAIPHPANSP